MGVGATRFGLYTHLKTGWTTQPRDKIVSVIRSVSRCCGHDDVATARTRLSHSIAISLTCLLLVVVVNLVSTVSSLHLLEKLQIGKANSFELPGLGLLVSTHVSTPSSVIRLKVSQTWLRLSYTLSG